VKSTSTDGSGPCPEISADDAQPRAIDAELEKVPKQLTAGSAAR